MSRLAELRVVALVALGGALAARAGAEAPKASPQDMAARLWAVPGFERLYRADIEHSRLRLRAAFDLGEDSDACAEAGVIQREHRRALDELLERASGRQAAEASFTRTFAALPERTRKRVATVLASDEFAAWLDASKGAGSFLEELAAALEAADRRERWSRAGVLDDMVVTGNALKAGLAEVAAAANATLKRDATALRTRNGPRALAALDACIAAGERRLREGN